MTARHRKTRTHVHAPSGIAAFEPAISLFERSKTVRALDRTVTGTG